MPNPHLQPASLEELSKYTRHVGLVSLRVQDVHAVNTVF